MPVRIYKPTSPGRRKSSVSTFQEITKHEPEKALIVSLPSRAGRNVQGKITVRHQGSGHKQYYRLVDFKRERYDLPATVKAIEYDPNRSARLALLEYSDGEKRYILAPLELQIGMRVVSSHTAVPIQAGNRAPLEKIPVGQLVHNVELTPGKGGEIVRSAGTAATLMAIEGDFAHLKLPSGEVRMVPRQSAATIGQVSNVDHFNVRWGKAGRMRHRGIRPSVRGKAMNPVDHPHGGGEGVNPIGLKYPKTPWGKHALGVKTRRKHRRSDYLIIRHR
ncbi:MAG: 50S ribosomal protein L2, partial [Candidatus Kerfeldbacteria bacterium]|nr:50S ribosomal protein L2 [Candidatus Kerfeldbacteria bacterium]